MHRQLNFVTVEPGNGCRPLLARTSGFSLVEMLIALVVLSVAILGLTSVSIQVMQTNRQTELRNTAVRLSDQVKEAILARDIDYLTGGELSPYDDTNTALLPDYEKFPNPSQLIRGGVNMTFDVSWTVTVLSPELMSQVDLQVAYNYKGQTFYNRTVFFKHETNF